MSKIEKVAIIGVGLIGGSLGLALKKRPSARGHWKIIGAGRHIEKLRLAARLGAVDAYTMDFSKAASMSDIVVICAPVKEITPIIKRIITFIKPGTVITDTGSVKSQIVSEVGKFIGEKVYFVGAHPLAGSEKAGVLHSSANLFENATVVITEDKKKQFNRSAFNLIRKMWQDAGGRVIVMSPAEHDTLVAATSHLSHVLSAALIGRIADCNKKEPRVKKLLAGSFRDLTRISDSDPQNWAEICTLNSMNLRKEIHSYIRILKKVIKILEGKKRIKYHKIKKYFEDMKKKRCQLLE
ncbi:MAG: prephenate dehydrogenase, partial [Elusimicrobiota bacterium]